VLVLLSLLSGSLAVAASLGNPYFFTTPDCFFPKSTCCAMPAKELVQLLQQQQTKLLEVPLSTALLA
jgi:hypothetical protein